MFEKFESFASLETLLRLVINNQITPKELEELIKKKGLYNLTPAYKEKITRKLSKVDNQSAKTLETILTDENFNRGSFNRNEYFELIFDKEFIISVKATEENLTPLLKPEKKFKEEESEKVINDLVQSYKNKVAQHGFDFKVEIDHAPGFAEYWPDVLTESNENSLIIHQNSDNQCLYNLELTFAHEIFPGHGYFYDLRQKQNPSFIDEGSYFLIEGWATLAEWMETQNPRADYNKKTGIGNLKKMLATDYAQTEHLMVYYKGKGVSDEYLAVLEETYLQLPGFLESYYLGALWLDKIAGIKSPLSFNRFMQNRAWGDCFKLW